jgi:Gylcosyl hydrolase family 115 C-terminal domain
VAAPVPVPPTPAPFLRGPTAAPNQAPVPSPSPPSGATFKEVQGLVSMEAEHADTITDWKTVAGLSGSALEDTGGSLSYSINFSQPGNYTVYLLARYTGNDQRSRNDCLVRLNGEKLYAGDGVTRPDGMRTHSSTGAWTFLPKGPGTTTPDGIKNLPVFFRVTAAGDYSLVLSSRSVGFVVDKIVLKRNGGSTGKPTSTGPAETFA